MKAKKILITIVRGIAAIVVGLVLIVIFLPNPNESSINTRAKFDAVNIVLAIDAYKTEYGTYPPVGPPSATMVLLGDPVAGAALPHAPIDNGGLFNILRNIPDVGVNKNYEGNPKKITFFEGISVRSPNSPKNGFQDDANAPHKGCFFDPWGTQYFIIIDMTGSGHLQADAIYEDFKGKLPAVGVGAFSFGKDRKLGSPSKGVVRMYHGSDDQISWQ